jgi:hypothetical protein
MVQVTLLPGEVLVLLGAQRNRDRPLQEAQVAAIALAQAAFTRGDVHGEVDGSQTGTVVANLVAIPEVVAYALRQQCQAHAGIDPGRGGTECACLLDDGSGVVAAQCDLAERPLKPDIGIAAPKRRTGCRSTTCGGVARAGTRASGTCAVLWVDRRLEIEESGETTTEIFCASQAEAR